MIKYEQSISQIHIISKIKDKRMPNLNKISIRKLTEMNEQEREDFNQFLKDGISR